MGLKQENIFSFSIGGYPGPAFDVQVANDWLVCRSQSREKEEELVVKIAVGKLPAWTQLLGFLQTRKWQGNYMNEDILDGTHWQLELHTATIHMSATGSNAEPPGFRKFLRLLNEVLMETDITVY